MKSVIEDIFELRKEKMMRILKNIEPNTPIKFLSSCGSTELNSLRPAFTATYTVVNKMQNIIVSSGEAKHNDV